jgi:hypothetical protein
MWVILEFLNVSPREWAATSAFHVTLRPKFLSPQVYLRGNPFYLLLPFLCFSAAANASSSLRLFVLKHSIATSFPLHMRVKHLSQHTPMVKLANKKRATG